MSYDPRENDRRKRKREQDMKAAEDKKRQEQRSGPKNAYVPGVIAATPDRTITREGMFRRSRKDEDES